MPAVWPTYLPSTPAAAAGSPPIPLDSQFTVAPNAGRLADKRRMRWLRPSVTSLAALAFPSLRHRPWNHLLLYAGLLSPPRTAPFVDTSVLRLPSPESSSLIKLGPSTGYPSRTTAEARALPGKQARWNYLPFRKGPIMSNSSVNVAHHIVSRRLFGIPLAAAIFIPLVLTVQVLAADPGTVRGIVHDSQHRPIENATVTVHGQSAGGLSKAAQSDANGEFEVDGVPEGDYFVTVSAPGFARWTRPLK